MVDPDPFAVVARRLVPDGRLLRRWPLEGGVSAAMHALELRDSRGESRRVVVRREPEGDIAVHVVEVPLDQVTDGRRVAHPGDSRSRGRDPSRPLPIVRENPADGL